MQNLSFNQAQVLVVGDIMLDRYWTGNTGRISPEAPVPVVRIDEDEDRIGGAGNVAINIASLGGSASIFACAGDDPAAAKIEQMLHAQGINSFLQKIDDMPTPVKLRVLSKHQQLIRMDFEQKFDEIEESELINQFSSFLATANVIVLSDYGKGVLSDPQAFIDKAGDIPVLVDPKGTDFSKYKNATLITPNRSEFEAVAGECSSQEEIADKAYRLINDLGLKAMLITLSEDGMLLVTAENKVKHTPTRAREVFDVTGAGDTVIASFAASIGAGLNFVEAMEVANMAAGIVVGKLGTSSVSQEELWAASIRLDNKISSKIQAQEQLKNIIRNTPDKKFVMTNGCFDILHAGHVSYLQAAKSLGNKLIVAVNSDDSVMRLKGENRPIQNLEQRMEVLAALESVDYVVPFTSDTPEELYCDILPNVLVKGGDYKPEELSGGKCVKDNGGEVKVLDFVAGQSTSAIIDKIKGIKT